MDFRKIAHAYITISKWTACLSFICYALIAYSANADSASTHFEMGLEAFNSDQIEASIQQFKRTIAEDPTYADAYYHLGLAYYKKAKFDEAISSLRKAIELVPGDVDAHIKIGMAYYKSGKLKEAVDAYWSLATLGKLMLP